MDSDVVGVGDPVGEVVDTAVGSEVVGKIVGDKVGPDVVTASVVVMAMKVGGAAVGGRLPPAHWCPQHPGQWRTSCSCSQH